MNPQGPQAPESVLSIVVYPHPALRKVASPVAGIDAGVRDRAKAMIELMVEANGIGLAAPQVDWSARVFVVSATGKAEDARVYVNPSIVGRRGKAREEEGCLSLPEIRGKVERAEWIRVEYQDLEGRPQAEEAEDLHARAIQHEYDHLDGILILSRMSPAERKLVTRRLKDLEERARDEAARAGSSVRVKFSG